MPSATEAVAWIRAALDRYDARHAGEPGRVTVRRLTSAEYAYALRDLTGIDVKVGVDASSDAVGGEGFANFGDVQFVQDASVERYLEAAKQVADHAVIGAGPLDFYADPGKTGLELSALNRIEQLYTTRGFRVVSGEGGRPFGFDRYGKALYVAWHYRHRVRPRRADGHRCATLAAREGITGRFAEHIWDVVNRTRHGVSVTADDRSLAGAPGARRRHGGGDRAGAQRVRRPGEVARHLAQLVLRARRPRGRWPGRREPARVRRHDARRDADHRPTSTRSTVVPLRPAARIPGPWTVHLSVDALHRGGGEAPMVIWRNARVVLRTPPPPPPATPEPAAVARARVPGPIVETRSLRSVLPADVVARLGFGTSPDGTPLGPDDFATREGTSFVIDIGRRASTSPNCTWTPNSGADREAVMRVMVVDTATGVARAPGQRVFLGDPASEGYRTFRAGIAEYVALLPPNSHGAANPADKDPVPAPFDNTYNSPEHDAFVTKVKYQRTDDFFTRNIVDGEDRARLEHGVDRPVRVLAVPRRLPRHAARPLRGHRRQPDDREHDAGAHRRACPPLRSPTCGTLRAHHEAVQQAMRRAEPGHVVDALAFASRAWRRPLTPGRAAVAARVLPHVAHGAAARSRRRDAGAAGAHPDVAVLPLSPRGVTAPHRDEAERLGNRQPAQLLPVVVDSGRRAAARGGGGRTARPAGASPGRSGG